MPVPFPFSAIAGLDDAKKALLILAVDPRLKGVLMPRPCGLGGDLLLDGFKSLLVNEPVVHLPCNVTDDRLFGALDIERTISTGRPYARRGLLAEAHGGFVAVENVHLLERGLTAQVAQVLNAGKIRVERESVSTVCTTEFALIAMCDPGERAPEVLLDSVAVDLGCAPPQSDELEMLVRVEAFYRNPAAFNEQYGPETQRLQRHIAASRERLSLIRMSVRQVRTLAEAAVDYGIQSHRADLFAGRFARAHAAWSGRMEVAEGDVELAIRWVIEPRRGEKAVPSPAQQNVQTRERTSPQPGTPAKQGTTRPIATVDCAPPEGALNAAARPGRATGRRKDGSSTELNKVRGRYVGAVADSSNEGRVAFEATLRAAARHQRPGQCGIKIAPESLRFKRFRQQAGVLIVFAVDASGSMALNRIGHAKGALTALLREAHVRRDKVALIAFGGGSAKLLLGPTRSVHLARRVVDSMEVGGATPLTACLETTLKLVRRCRNSRLDRVLLALFTDGRANVGLEQLDTACTRLREARVVSVVIDTNAVRARTAENLAARLGGRHLQLPRIDTAAAGRILAGIAAGMRGTER